jgi:hypothetical protein
MMWLFPPLAVLYIFLISALRGAFEKPASLSAFAASYLFLIPRFSERADGGSPSCTPTPLQRGGAGRLPKNFGEFVGMQLGAVSPIVAVLLFSRRWAACSSGNACNRANAFL